MPYQSAKQRRYLHAHPEITDKKGRSVAGKWDEKYGGKVQKGLSAQPRFSGNGGHGKRYTEDQLDESVRKSDANDIAQIKRNAKKDSRGKIIRDVGLITAGASIPMKNPRTWIPTAVAGTTASITGGTMSRNARKNTGSVLARRASTPVAKKARTYDAELNRQRRQGMWTAGGLVGGGALAASGGREAARDIRAGRDVAGAMRRLGSNDIRFQQEAKEFGPLRVGQRKYKTVVNDHPMGRQLTEAERKAFDRLPNLGQRMSGRTKGKLGAGAALIAGGAGMYRHSRSSGNKRWN